MDSLIIIGNGFDLFHGIPSSYKDFRDDVYKYHKDLYAKVKTLCYDSDSLWSDFEKALGEPDFEAIREDAKNCIQDSKHTDGNWHIYAVKIKETLIPINTLVECFKEWAYRLEKSVDMLDCPRIELNNNAKYINFNYTSTLERVYGINEKNILYIHNRVNTDNDLIVGHNNDNSVEKNYEINEQYNMNEEGEAIENVYLQSTIKDTGKIIEENELFFSTLSNIKRIFVLGHSLSDIDKVYFEKISDSIDENCHWVVSYYSDNERCSHINFLIEIGINKDLIKLEKIDKMKIIENIKC